MSIKRSYGRIVLPDSRDSGYLLSLPKRVSGLRSYRNWYSRGWHGNQGSDSSCVGYGWSHWLHTSPFRQFLNPTGIYKLAQYLDNWEGENYFGTSVRAGAKVLSWLGAIGEYKWTLDANVITYHILTTGPVVIGVQWYEGMSYPNKDGVMSISGKLLGGHCVCVVGYNSKTELFTIKNSYGEEWGNNGYGYLLLEDLQTLLSRDGEACVGIETKLSPK